MYFDMPILSLTHVKGGVGKSTTAVMLAYWLSQHHSVIVVDADTQRSSSVWLKSLNLPYKIEQNPDKLINLSDELAAYYDYVIIDCAGGLSDLTRAALLVTDMTLIPTQPSGLDIDSLKGLMTTLEAVRRVRKGQPITGVFLSIAKKGRRLLKEAIASLSEYPNCHRCSQIIYDRECIRDAFLQGETVWQQSGESAHQAALDYERFFTEALEVLNAKA